MKLFDEASVGKVSLLLCLTSLGLGLAITAIEYLIGHELTGTGVVSTVVPAMATGAWFGGKSGELMPSKTRWNSLLIWMAVSMCYAFILILFLDISITDLLLELGWFNLAIIVLLALSLVLSYFVFKSGEKIGIKSFIKRQENAIT